MISESMIARDIAGRQPFMSIDRKYETKRRKG